MLSFIKKRKEQKGFTLIEVMLVVAMIAMLASMTIPISFGSLKKQSVEEESSKLLGILRQTQAKSMEGRDDSLWGVYFTPESYTVFKGNSYEEREPVYDEVFELFSDINVAGAPEIVFDYQGIPIIKGLVGHWTMNEGEGGVAHDLSGNDNHGTLVNGPTWANGKAGEALDFDGASDYIAISDSEATTSNLAITGAITLSAWVKLNDMTSEVIMGRGSGTGSAGNYGYVLMVYNGSVVLNMHSNTAVYALGSVLATDSNWHFITATWDGTMNTNGVKIYIDGTLSRQGTSTISVMGQPVYQFRIGVSSSSLAYVNGLIDDVRIYNRALTEDEVRLIYESGLDGVDDNIIELSDGSDSVKINVGRQGRIEVVR